MIRGTGQTFKFTTPYNFEDINNIVAVFSQPHNTGTTSAPMPINKYYNKKIENIDTWSETGKNQENIYCIGTKYYRYNSDTSQFISSTTKPAETDILSTDIVTTWPLSDNYHISKAYKCGQSYYQYNPTTTNWDITTTAPSADYITLENIGVNNIPSTADKKRILVFNKCYYKHNGATWESSDKILPIEEVNYWQQDKENSQTDGEYYYDRNKTYCALETYYKYVDGEWGTYGSDCIYPIEVYAWNSEDTSQYDKSKIYMLKEFYYQYNVETDQFEKTAIRKVYYKYNAINSAWEECEAPDITVEEVDLWINSEAYAKNISTIYVCKHAYYRYNAQLETPGWEASNNMLIPIIEINEWDSADYHDTNKIYMLPTKYYQYNISKNIWEEKNEAVQQKTIKLDYWTDPTDFDKNQIYLCGPTYFQYSSENTKWLTSSSFNMQLVKINDSKNATDLSKVYECSPIYYAYKDGAWTPYTSIVDATRNDGFQPVEGDPKSFVIVLSAEETMRFNDRYKGRVQVVVRSNLDINPIASPITYFTVYPTLTNEILGVTPSSATELLQILDAGNIIEE